MKPIKIIVILVLLSLLIPGVLFPRISSRIEGIVLDKDTGKPIKRAWVLLYREDRGITKTTQTNKDGFYKFEGPPVFPGKKYYLRCTASGYAPSIPEYYFEAVKAGYFDEIFQPFLLEEGQIKHIKIILEKGGSLKGLLYIKDSSGISPFKEVTVFLRKKKNSNEYFLKDTIENERFYLADTKTNEYGEFNFYDLQPSDGTISDEYIIELSKLGYYLPEEKKINVNKGIVNQLEYTIDMSNPTELNGIIKINGEPPMSGEGILYPLSPNNSGSYYTINAKIDKEGNYFFKGVLPGKYKIEISCYFMFKNQKERILESRIVDIIKEQSIVLNFNLNKEE